MAKKPIGSRVLELPLLSPSSPEISILHSYASGRNRLAFAGLAPRFPLFGHTGLISQNVTSFERFRAIIRKKACYLEFCARCGKKNDTPSWLTILQGHRIGI